MSLNIMASERPSNRLPKGIIRLLIAFRETLRRRKWASRRRTLLSLLLLLLLLLLPAAAAAPRFGRRVFGLLEMTLPSNRLRV